MLAITTSTSTTANTNSTEHKRLSLQVSPTSSTSSTLANRRRNNKNLSLCLSPESTSKFLNEPIKTASIKTQKPIVDDINAYPLGPVQIMPNLYLGSEKNANDLNQLKNLSITAILNVAAEVNNPYIDELITPSPSLSQASSVSSGASSIQTVTSSESTSLFAYQKLPWEHNQDNLVVELKKAIDIIDRARSANQTILVHCQCGVARSATVIIAYVIKTLKLPMQEAYTHVKQLSPAISPNLGLLFQLREFEQSCLQQQQQQQQQQPVPVPVQQVEKKRSAAATIRPKSWINPTPTEDATKEKIPTTPTNSRFLFRASSLCISNTWKRKLSRSTKSIFSTSSDEKSEQENNDGWWKTNSRKLSTDTPVCY
ncbi:unnamed protein product [Mucor hiemalis]